MRWVVLVLMLLFAGCGTKSYYFIAPPKPAHVHQEACTIGVTDVQLPEYALVGKLLYRDGVRAGYMEDFIFAQDPQELFTDTTISYLRRAFPKAQVLGYPWDVRSQPDRIVRIVIEEFYYDRARHSLVLQGVVHIGSQRSGFTLHQAVGSSLQTALDRIMARYLREIATAVDRSCR